MGCRDSPLPPSRWITWCLRQARSQENQVGPDHLRKTGVDPDATVFIFTGASLKSSCPTPTILRPIRSAPGWRSGGTNRAPVSANRQSDTGLVFSILIPLLAHAGSVLNGLYDPFIIPSHKCAIVARPADIHGRGRPGRADSGRTAVEWTPPGNQACSRRIALTHPVKEPRQKSHRHRSGTT